MINSADIPIGTLVHYIPFEGADKSQYENGKIKSRSDENHIFVVFNCAGEWDNYQNYTGQRTRVEDLHLGWV